MGKALYRKYRARTLSEIRGQDHITVPLANSLKSGKISHAYLFTGPRGTGKTSVARILAHEINQFSYELEDSYVDIIEIDAASNTGVDNIRELRERAAIAPTLGKYKIYIIDEVHMLSKSAFNALLKTLEEPPAHVVFIMATTDPEKVPVTIISRSQQYQFRLSDQETMVKHLADIAKTEKIKITNDALALIAQRGGGSFRDSISLLDQISILITGEITREAIESALGLPNSELLDEIFIEYSMGNAEGITNILATLATSGVKPDVIASELISHITITPSPTAIRLIDGLIDVARSPHPAAKLLVTLLADIPIVQTTEISSVTQITSTITSQPVIEETPAVEEMPPVEEIKKSTKKLTKTQERLAKAQNKPTEPSTTSSTPLLSDDPISAIMGSATQIDAEEVF